MDLFTQVCVYIAMFGLSDLLVAKCCGHEPRCRLVYFLVVALVGWFSHTRF